MTRDVIITRAQPGAGETALRLEKYGYRPVLSPLLTVSAGGVRPEGLGEITDFVFTSANGVRIFMDMQAGADDRTAWCVGPSTAAQARIAGFKRVIEGAGNGDDLADVIIARKAGITGKMMHIANAAAGERLASTLRAAGMEARFCPAYATLPASGLSQAAQAALGRPGTAILLHSPKAGAVLAGLEAPLEGAVIIAISAAAADPLRRTGHNQCIIAPAPNEEALLGTLQKAAPA